ncbi:MAG: hypothetical protein QNJ42_17580 [Crocosphaera sp.]|nr:hypothetical protein [Crocosphaera sp.]
MNDDQLGNIECNEIPDFIRPYKIRDQHNKGWQTALNFELMKLAKDNEVSLEEMRSIFYDYYFRKSPDDKSIDRIIYWFKRNLKTLLRNTVVILSFLAVIVPLYQLLKEIPKDIRKKEIRDITTYATYGEFLKKYNKKIQPSIFKILNSQNIKINDTNISLISVANTNNQDSDKLYFKLVTSNNEEDYDNEGNYTAKSPDNQRFNRTCKALVNATNSKTAYELYYSDNDYFENFRTIHEFFASLSLAIDKKAIEFDSVFELITYPASDGSSDEQSLSVSFNPLFEIENCLKKHWFGIDNQLTDFSYHFLRLKKNYHYKRIQLKQKQLNCKKLKVENTERCEDLQEIKEKIEKDNNTSKLPWKKLYPNNKKTILWNLWN